MNSDQTSATPSSEPTPRIQVGTLVEILPTRVWVESDMFGGRHVMLQHQGMEPFTYASFHYNYMYTSNSGTWEAAHALARSLGAVDPIENRQRGFNFPTADELREEIKSMQEELARMEAETPPTQ